MNSFSARLIPLLLVLTLTTRLPAYAGSIEWEALNAEVTALYRQGAYNLALGVAKQSLKLVAQAIESDHADAAWSRIEQDFATSLNNLALLYATLGDYGQAEPLYKRSLAIREKSLGSEHPDVAMSLSNLAGLYLSIGQFVKTERCYKRALKIYEDYFGSENATVATVLNNLAMFYKEYGQYAQAEQSFKRSLDIYEKLEGPDAPAVATCLSNLASLYRQKSQYAQAETLYKRSLAIREKVLAPDHIDIAESLNNLALLYHSQNLYSQAEPLYNRALIILEKNLGPEHPDVATNLSNLALLHASNGKLAEAEQLHKRSLAIREKVLRPYHPEVGVSLHNLSILYDRQGEYAKAEALDKRALSILENAYGPDHPKVANILTSLAKLYLNWGRIPDAIAYSRRSFQLLNRRFSQATDSLAELKSHRDEFSLFISLVDRGRDATAAAESFEAYQLAQASAVGQSVALMAARFTTQENELAGAIRAQQDMIETLARKDREFIGAIGQPLATLDTALVARLRKELNALKQAATEQHRLIITRFPEYDSLVSPAPVPAGEAQMLLRDGEAMVTYLVDEDNGCYAWIIQRAGIHFFRLNISVKDIATYVDALRSRLDPHRNDPNQKNGLLPFDTRQAHELYLKIFAPLESALTGAKHVIIVPDGALQSLPFAVLVDKLPAGKSQTSWLTDRFAFSTVPSVAALRALRTLSQAKSGDLSFVGFGDPLLDGGAGEKRAISAVVLFSEKESSGKTHGLANVDTIRKASSLPETADELRALAKLLQVPDSALFLRSKATETMVKQMDLSRQRVLAFATHVIMAGELKGMAEPGLILTPPKEGTPLDDGYLSASEVAQLKLNADWVLLSACNTASSDGTPGAEGFSGLAKAFFYAGARSLLVSNWYVVSEATVRITTEMLKSYSTDLKIGKAEALRLAMAKLRKDSEFSHPLFWAPFVVVGEGGSSMAKKE